MTRDDSHSDHGQADQLDRLIRMYLEGADAGNPPDPEQLLREHPSLRADFFEFLRGHAELRGEESPKAVARQDARREPAYARTIEVSGGEGRTIGARQGEVLGDCEILEELGRGGMGVVYRARHVRVNDLRAVKILPRELVKDESIRRFWQEAQAAGSIRHPNVISVHDVGQQTNLHFIVMEYIAGKTLGEVLADSNQPMPWRTALRLTLPILDALTAIHERGLVHRDIKPSNIMVARASSVLHKRHVVLMDFGLVQQHAETEAQLTKSGAVLGTPAYMSREQACGEPVDARSDLYAIGATLYFLLAGRPPYQGTATEVYLQAAIGSKPDPLSTIRTDLPATLCQTIEQAMHPDIDQRHSSATHMLRPLADLLRQSSASPAKVGPVAQVESMEKAVDTAEPSVNPLARQDTASMEKNFNERVSAPTVSTAKQGALTAKRGSVAAVPRSNALRPIPHVRGMSLSPLKIWVRRFIAGSWSPAVMILIIVSLTLLLCVNLAAVWSSDSGETLTTQRSTDTEGMIRIPAGTVQLGGSPQRLRDHAKTLDSIKDSPELIDRFVMFCQEEPYEKVQLPAFWIDKYEVTNAQYGEFVASTNHPPPQHWNASTPPAGTEQHPICGIRHKDASAYAQWAGKQLPTVAQWTRAYRGSDDRMYPWGDRWNDEFANVAQNGDFPAGTSPVEASPSDVSPVGVYNLVGNVSEYMRRRVVYDGEPCVITKGAASQLSGDVYGAAPFRFFRGANDPHELTGFRCVFEVSE